MNNQQREQSIRERIWRGPLAPEQAAELRSNFLPGQPEAQAEFELETALTQALHALPDVPVSSNFTARVLAAAERKMAEQRRRRWSWHRLWRQRWRWLPHAGLAIFLVSGALFSFSKLQSAHQVRTIESLATVAEVASVPGPDTLRDFEAIRALSPSPAADVELLVLLQ